MKKQKQVTFKGKSLLLFFIFWVLYLLEEISLNHFEGYIIMNL